MYRTVPKSVKYNVVLNQGGLGDIIAAYSSFKVMLEKFPHHDYMFFVPEYVKELTRFVFPKAQVYDFSDTHKFESRPILHTGHDLTLFLTMHITDVMSVYLLQTILEGEDRNYVQPDLSTIELKGDLKRDYSKSIAIATLSRSDTREFDVDELKKLIIWIRSKGYEPVFIGREAGKDYKLSENEAPKKLPIDYSQGLNLINKTSLVELLKIISECRAMIGVDNGLMHLAAMTSTPIIGGFTNVDPKHRIPKRKGEYYPVVPEESLACRFCQTNWLLDDQKHTKCYEGDYKCVKQMTAAKFVEQLKRIDV